MEEIREYARKNIPQIIGINNFYSVLVPIIKIEGKDNILFEVRSKKLRTQPGEISFPGGRIEENESPEKAAIRETSEELLISENDIQYYGQSDTVVNANLSIIYSFIGEIKLPLEKVGKNPSEVEEIFTVPLQYFLENEPQSYELEMKVRENNKFPYELIPNGKNYRFKRGKDKVYFYKYKDKIIWGFTAKILKNIKDKISI